MTRTTLALLAFVGLVTLTSLAPDASSIRVREDAENEYYLIGTLTWNKGVGGISWSGAPSEDPGGAGTGNSDRDIYTSEPLPFRVHLNASRLIKIDVYTKDWPTPRDAFYQSGSSCQGPSAKGSIAAEVFVGDALVGWTSGSEFGGQGGATLSFPPDPPGYGVCRIRIASEVSVLEQGSVLRLKLLHSGPSTPFGFAEDHASTIRIPYFSDGEVAYRFPTHAHGLAFAAPGSSGIGSALGLLGLGAAPVAALLRPRRATVLLALLLCLGAFAGCLGTKTEAPTARTNAPATGTLEPLYQNGSLAKGGLGSLIGQVEAADTRQPLHGAAVSLLGTPHGTRTDPYGRFFFSDLRPDSYRIRVDRQDYQSFEGRVTVRADLIARVNVTLHPTGDASPERRAHFHDSWDEKPERLIMKREGLGTMPYTGLGYDVPGFCGVVNPCRPSPVTAFTIPAREGEVRTIIPGTYDINLTFDWDPKVLGYSQVSLRFQANNDANFYNYTELKFRGPGEPFHIATTWEMHDPGHQDFSSWLFYLIPGGTYTQPTPSGDPEYFATITLRKGVVPLEPAHADLWKGSDQADVIRDLERSVGMDGYGNGWNTVWLPRAKVPSDTKWVEILLNATADRFVDYGLDLRYKVADAAPSGFCWANGEDNHAYACDGPEYRHVLGRVEPQNRWVLELAPGEADPHYAHRSFWLFGLKPNPEPGYQVGMAASGIVTFTLTVIAHRDAVPT